MTTTMIETERKALQMGGRDAVYYLRTDGVMSHVRGQAVALRTAKAHIAAGAQAVELRLGSYNSEEIVATVRA